MHGIQRADQLPLRTPVLGIITMDKKQIMKAIYDIILVEDKRINEMRWSRIIDFGIKYGSNRRGV